MSYLYKKPKNLKPLPPPVIEEEDNEEESNVIVLLNGMIVDVDLFLGTFWGFRLNNSPADGQITKELAGFRCSDYLLTYWYGQDAECLASIIASDLDEEESKEFYKPWNVNKDVETFGQMSLIESEKEEKENN